MQPGAVHVHEARDHRLGSAGGGQGIPARRGIEPRGAVGPGAGSEGARGAAPPAVILVDSSAWIEYYHRRGSREVRDAVFSTIRDNPPATNGTILVEVAAYAARDADAANLRSDLSGSNSRPPSSSLPSQQQASMDSRHLSVFVHVAQTKTKNERPFPRPVMTPTPQAPSLAKASL